MRKTILVLSILLVTGLFTVAIGDDAKKDGDTKPAAPALPPIFAEYRKFVPEKVLPLRTNFTLDGFNEAVAKLKDFAGNKEFPQPVAPLLLALNFASLPEAVKLDAQLAEKTINDFIVFVNSDQFDHPEAVKKSVVSTLKKEKAFAPLRNGFTLDKFNKAVAEIKVLTAQKEFQQPGSALLSAVRFASEPEAVKLDAQLAEKTISDFIVFVNSDQFDYHEAVKKNTVTTLERKAAQIENATKRSLGSDLKLYGKNIDGSDFDWDSLRGKYVVVKFTATWCGPCRAEIPGLISAYDKYHDKGLEIISVYVWERGNDNDKLNEHIIDFAQKEKINWRLISEPLTLKAGGSKIGDFYGVEGVPTILLIDKEGKIIDTEARGQHLQNRLAEIFDGTTTATK